MARTPPMETSGWAAPVTQVHGHTRDAHELRAVLDGQATEMQALKAKLSESQHECIKLRQRLQDAESDLAVAAEASQSAAVHLGDHAARHELVLAAGVERSGAERVAVEHELQRVEALLHVRDQEIRKLRQQAYELEALDHQQEMALRGMRVAHQATSSHAKAMTEEVEALTQRVRGGFGLGADSAQQARVLAAFHREKLHLEETEAALTSKLAEHASLKQRSEAAMEQAANFDEEERVLAESVRAFERSLLAKREQLTTQEQRALRENEQLREHNNRLRSALILEQRDAASTDQREVLRQQASADADSVKSEAARLLETMPRLAEMLRRKGRRLVSAEVPGDAVDKALHAFVRGCDPSAGDALPSLIWRLARGEYLFGGERVGIFESNGSLMLSHEGGLVGPLADAVRQPPGGRQAPRSVEV